MPSLDPDRIDADADRVVRRLKRAGHDAYLVGGCVRDLLLGRRPKDFDVATSATPNEIKALFRNCRIIGRRFRLAHVFFGEKIIETSTFRANPRDEDAADLLIRRDNVFGNETEDARRRDFTINGLFYDVESEEVIDHVGGLVDLEARLIRTIGEPGIRFQEDPVRMLRAVKFAARLDFQLEEATHRALLRWRGEVRKCAPPRVLEEVYRLLRSASAHRSLEILVETGTLRVLSPHLASLLEAPPSEPEHAADADAEDQDELEAEPRELDAEEAAWHRTWADDREPRGLAPRISFLRDRAELARRRQAAWAVLHEADLVAAKREVSSALVLAAILAPFVIDEIASPHGPGNANAAILEIGQPLIDQLHIPRRDAERVRQALLAQRRIAPLLRNRARPNDGRDFIEDAILLYELLERAAGRGDALELPPPDGEGGEGGEGDDLPDDPRRKRRRRRRGGRRRRVENHGEAAAS